MSEEQQEIAVVQQIIQLFAIPDRWIKGVYGRDSRGQSTEKLKSASCNCLVGAIMRFTERGSSIREAVIERIAACLPVEYLQSMHCVQVTEDTPLHIRRNYVRAYAHGLCLCFNDRDSTRHEDVIAVLERAVQPYDVKV